MDVSTLVGYALLLAGIVLGLLPFLTGSSTIAGCPEIHSTAYEILGIHPAGFEVRAIDPRQLRLAWYDGCNARRSSLVPHVVGTESLLSGMIVITGGVPVFNDRRAR